MNVQKKRIDEIESDLLNAKAVYKEAMINLSKISEEVNFE
jgi:hypothetical protein